MTKLREDTEKHPELQDFDDSGRSGAVSSVGTPMTFGASNGTRLKLTFGANQDRYPSNGVSDEE